MGHGVTLNSAPSECKGEVLSQTHTTLSQRRASLIFIRDTGEGRAVLMLKHTLNDGSTCWTTPGGKVHRDETLLAAATREFIEEVGPNLLQTEPTLVQAGGTTYFQTEVGLLPDDIVATAFAQRSERESKLITEWEFVPLDYENFMVWAASNPIRKEDKSVLLSLLSCAEASSSDISLTDEGSDSEWYDDDRSDDGSTDDISVEDYEDSFAHVDEDEKECLKTTDWGWLGLPQCATRERVDSILRHFGLKRGPYNSSAFKYHLRNHPDRNYAKWVERAIDVGVDAGYTGPERTRIAPQPKFDGDQLKEIQTRLDKEINLGRVIYHGTSLPIV